MLVNSIPAIVMRVLYWYFRTEGGVKYSTSIDHRNMVVLLFSYTVKNEGVKRYSLSFVSLEV